MARFGLRREKRASRPQEGNGAGEQPQAMGPQPGAAPAPEPTIPERLEGLRAWVAQLDRRIGVRTYAVAAALVLALAAAAVALVLVLQLEDESASDSDIQQLREEIAGVEDTAAEAAQEDVQSLSDRLTDIESQISEIASDRDSVNQEISVIKDDIQDLRDQLAEVDSAGAGGAGGGSGGSP
jgi:uncharacterized protein HemX